MPVELTITQQGVAKGVGVGVGGGGSVRCCSQACNLHWCFIIDYLPEVIQNFYNKHDMSIDIKEARYL